MEDFDWVEVAKRFGAMVSSPSVVSRRPRGVLTTLQKEVYCVFVPAEESGRVKQQCSEASIPILAIALHGVDPPGERFIAIVKTPNLSALIRIASHPSRPESD